MNLLEKGRIRRMDQEQISIKFLQANNGDCILVSYYQQHNDPVNILIDGGTGDTYLAFKDRKGKPVDGPLKKLIQKIRQEKQSIDLLILTHIDEDHIAGILRWFSFDLEAADLIKEVWFNGGKQIADLLELDNNPDLNPSFTQRKTLKTSVRSGVDFAKYIHHKKIWSRQLIIQGNKIEKFGMTFRILSPNVEKLELLLKEWKKEAPDSLTARKRGDYHQSIAELLKSDKFEEDKSPTNGSSIAFILTVKEKNFIFLGDSHPSVVQKGLEIFQYSDQNPIKAELVKIAHHGSSGNTSRILLNTILSSNFAISTNGKHHQHPDKKMLAVLIEQKKNIKIFFNYIERTKEIFSTSDLSDYPTFEIADLNQPLNFLL